MKKAITIILALVMVLSLVACGGNQQSSPHENGTESIDNNATDNTTTTDEVSLSKEEMINKSQPLTINEIAEEIYNNKARAKGKYANGTYSIWGTIIEINSDSCDISVYKYPQVFVRVYLPVDELIQLNQNEAIQVVGIITDIFDETEQVYEYSIPRTIISMQDAFFITNIYEINNASFSSMSYSRTNYNYNAVISDSVLGPIKVELTDKQISNAQWNRYEKLKISATGIITDYVLNSDDIVITE